MVTHQVDIRLSRRIDRSSSMRFPVLSPSALNNSSSVLLSEFLHRPLVFSRPFTCTPISRGRFRRADRLPVIVGSIPVESVRRRAFRLRSFKRHVVQIVVSTLELPPVLIALTFQCFHRFVEILVLVAMLIPFSTHLLQLLSHLLEFIVVLSTLFLESIDLVKQITLVASILWKRSNSMYRLHRAPLNPLRVDALMIGPTAVHHDPPFLRMSHDASIRDSSNRPLT